MFNRWHLALQSFLDNAGESLSPTNQQAARVLQLNLFVLALEVDVTANEDLPHPFLSEYSAPWLLQLPYRLREDPNKFETSCFELSPLARDMHTPRFQQIIALVRDAVKHAVVYDAPVHFRQFWLDTTIVAPLYFVAYICRDPKVRREAVSSLYRLPHQEGSWDSLITARSCEKLMEIDKEGLGEVLRAEDIPEWARIREVKASTDAEGRLDKISYRRFGKPWEPEGSDHEKWLQLIL